jgi:serine/threonine-protein kinase
VASGGTCAYNVNGAPQGTSTSFTLRLRPGTYAVTCKPEGQPVKSKTVKVQGGRTSFVTFKL